VYEVDFLPVEAEAGPSSKSGDAICIRFTDAAGAQRVVVIDAGFAAMGETVASFVKNTYGTNRVDLLISTHPDGDHLNGLKVVVEELYVSELLIHRPREHATVTASTFPNLPAVDELLATAALHRTTVTEPFTGVERFDGMIRVLAPREDFYEQMLGEQLAEDRVSKSALAAAVAMLSATATKATDMLKRKLGAYPDETLGEDGETTPRNESSVVTLLTDGDRRLLFTGDAGINGLDAAADEYERQVGPLWMYPLTFVQVPHHGSRRNVSPSLLDRLLGSEDSPHGVVTAFVSSAAADLKHPSSKVTNAFGRRGAVVAATEGIALLHSYEAGPRAGYGPVDPIGPLVEDDDA
jgi:beta-lactamase superfamily II metal-dependent hydrolase